MPAPSFEILARASGSDARAGILYTEHGPIPTPAFAPVGTQGAVKALSPRELEAIGVHLLMSNAYHLAMRPGIEIVEDLGGLHALAGWSGPIVTDSGGFQVFSLDDRARVDDEGVTFRSHVDGSRHRFTPESVVALQQALGSDLAMPLDVCSQHPATRQRAEEDLRRTLSWAARARDAHGDHPQLLYGIVQGSTYPDLRQRAAERIAGLGFDAYAIGGVSVGESKAQLWSAVDASLPALPEARPRHLLGVGHPEDLIEGIARGIDSFDCVMPTRVARMAGALTMQGRLNLRNAKHAKDRAPIEDACGCYTCRRFSRGALRHFLKAGEILGAQLLTLHNLHFTLRLVAEAREAILAGRFDTFRRRFLIDYEQGAHAQFLDSARPEPQETPWTSTPAT